MNRLVTHGRERRPNSAFEQPVKLSNSARVQRVCYLAPSARLRHLRAGRSTRALEREL